MQPTKPSELLSAFEEALGKTGYIISKPMTSICSICHREFTGKGHSAHPVTDGHGRCCDLCNDGVVVPIRRTSAARDFLTKVYKLQQGEGAANG